MIAAIITRDEAREQARARLAEVLSKVVPGFRSECPFRCLAPDHEDRHPSARYLSRANKVKCFACGWFGDVFDVVGAVYGLAGGDAFAKTYEILGFDPKGGGRSRPTKSSKPRPQSGTWDEIVSLIYPPGWDAPEPEMKLPLPLEVIAEAEIGLAGILARDPASVFVCLELGLRGWHFNDADLGEFFESVRTGAFPDEIDLGFTSWLWERAAPAHMLCKLSRFIMHEGQRRELEATFARAYSDFQNQDPPDAVLDYILNRAELVLGKRFAMPSRDEAVLRAGLDGAFRYFHNSEDVLSIAGTFRRAW